MGSEKKTVVTKKTKNVETAAIVEEHGLGAVIEVAKDDLLKTAKSLKKKGFDLFLFVSGIDYPEDIGLMYRMVAAGGKKTESVFIRTKVPKSEPVVASLTSIWPNADWHERETYDLYGVEFKGHPNLKRIFMPEDWMGFPLRKGYSDDHMLVFPEVLKEREKQEAKKAAASIKEEKEGQDG
jgi:NADH-quinone oxidoreductase subunit C